MELPDKSKPPAATTAPTGKNLSPVVSNVEFAPRPVTRRFFDFVFADSMGNQARRVAREIIMQRAKAGLEEGIMSFVHGMFWGTGAAPNSAIVTGTVIRGGVNAYHAASANPSAFQQAQMANQVNQNVGYQDIISGSQMAAETLLANMMVLLNQYSVVTIGDMKELADKSTAIVPSDNRMGWTNLDGARITQDSQGYRLALPKPTMVST